MKNLKRMLSLFLVLILLAGCIPLSAFADEPPDEAQIAEQEQEPAPTVQDDTAPEDAEPPLAEEPEAEPPAQGAEPPTEAGEESKAPLAEAGEEATVPTGGTAEEAPEEAAETAFEPTEAPSAVTEEKPAEATEEAAPEDGEAASGRANAGASGEASPLADGTQSVGTLWYGGYVYGSSTWSCTYTLKDGTHTASVSRVSLHRMNPDNSTQNTRIAYCIEPDKGSLGNEYSGTERVGMDENSWGANLTEAQQRAIGLIVLYGEQGRNGAAMNAKVSWKWEVATQILIWEIVVGYRSSTGTFARSNATLYNLYTGYLQNTSNTGAGYFRMTDAYDTIVNQLAQHNTIPSFTADTVGHMSGLTGKTEQALFEELKGVIFINPLHGYGNSEKTKYLTADEYLSGNVREKLVWAKRSAEQYPEDYAVNVEALERVQPVDLSASEISVRLGATWLPPEIVEKFMFELFATPRYMQWNIHVHFSRYTGEWNVEGKSYDRGNIKSNNTYGTERINGYRIIEETLNLRDVRIFDYVEDANGKKTAVLNKKETAIAQGKQELIKQAFTDWIWADPERRSRLTRLYNEKFNSIRPREYDGSHLNFVGINPEITLRPHQVNAIAHILYGGNTLLAHVVGAGKSATRS